MTRFATISMAPTKDSSPPNASKAFRMDFVALVWRHAANAIDWASKIHKLGGLVEGIERVDVVRQGPSMMARLR
jgi:hypothetical protein